MAANVSLALVLAWTVGLSLGLIGSGGSILMLPILVYVLHVPPQAAVGMTLLIVGVTSATGTYLHIQKGQFHRRAAVLLGSAGLVGAYLGSHATRLVSSSALMLVFAGIMVAVGVVMVRAPASVPPGERCLPLQCLAMGLGVGLLTGFLGVGGGFLIVPALVMLAGLDAQKAVGTSLAIITINACGGLVGQLRYTTLDWTVTAGVLPPTLVGLGIGVRYSARVSRVRLQTIFGWSILAVAVAISVVTLGNMFDALGPHS